MTVAGLLMQGGSPSSGPPSEAFGFGREERLLFRAAEPHGTVALARESAAADVDWERLVTLAIDQGIAGPVWRALQRAGAPLPTDLAARLAGIAAFSDFRLLEVHRLLERTVANLSAHGIPVVLVKGAALGACVYAEPGDRNMGDLDLLVPIERARDAVVVAAEADWSVEAVERRAALYEGHHHLPAMTDTLGLDIQLELHTDILPAGHPFHFGADAMRSRATERTLGATTVLVPSLEDLLVHACVHLGWSHEMRIGGWRTFRDVSEIVANPEFSWQRFLAIAEDRTIAPSCYWTLRLAARLCGTPVPGDVFAKLRPPMPKWVEEIVARHNLLQLSPGWQHPMSETLSRMLWSVGMRPRRSGHGTIRPWQFGDRFYETARAHGLDSPRSAQHWWSHRTRFRDVISQVRRLMSRIG